jgi:hypothetical protein
VIRERLEDRQPVHTSSSKVYQGKRLTTNRLIRRISTFSGASAFPRAPAG